MKRFLLVCTLAVLSLILSSCPESTSPKSTGGTKEIVMEKKSVSIDETGGKIELSDGSSIEIPSGGVSTSTVITLKKIKNDYFFSGDNRVSIDIDIDNVPKQLIIKIKVPEGLEKEDVGLFGYNPDGTEELEMTGIAPDFIYDAEKGFIEAVVNISAIKKKKENTQGSLLFKRWIAEWDENIDPLVETKLIQIPFYEQTGHSCWAACAAMLANSYTKYRGSDYEIKILDVLKQMNVGRDDGLGYYVFLKTLPSALKILTGKQYETSSFFRTKSCINKIVEEIGKEHPVIIHLPYPGTGAHAVIIIGYKKTTIGSGKTSYEFTLHNPQNSGEGMYTVHDADWIFSAKFLCEPVHILYPTDVPHTNRTLTTVGMALDGLVGNIEFKVPLQGTSSYKIRLVDKLTADNGYIWMSGNKDKGNIFNSIPDTATELYLRLPLWNSDLNNSCDAKARVTIYQEGVNSNVYDNSQDIYLPVSKNTLWFTKSVPLSDFVSAKGSNKYHFYVRLYKGGISVDGFNFYANIEPPHPLNGIWSINTQVIQDSCEIFNFKPDRLNIHVNPVNKTAVVYDADSPDYKWDCTFTESGDSFTLRYVNEDASDKITISGTLENEDYWHGTVSVYQRWGTNECYASGSIQGSRN
ncbi:MAG: papain-like cysteine protease family protein [bacterium]